METDLKKGLSLSGGGYRAALYALGSIWRLNDSGMLTELDTITAVSGGAVTSAYLMDNWYKLEFECLDRNSLRCKAVNFAEVIATPLQEIFRQKLTSPLDIFINTFNPFAKASQELLKKYERIYDGANSMADIAESDRTPEFIFYATNYDTGVSVRISKYMLRDYQIGTAINHDISLPIAVLASSGFPPFLAPVVLKGKDWTWEESPYSTLSDEVKTQLRERVELCDGGLYDNMGIEKLWKHGINREYSTVLCCDAGAPYEMPWSANKWFRKNWGSQFFRMTDTMINQQRALRKRSLIRNYLSGEYNGAYWSIEDNLSESKDVDPLIPETDYCKYSHLKNLSTRLSPFNDNDHQKLINWGYCHTDQKIRQWYDPRIATPSKVPFQVS